MNSAVYQTGTDIKRFYSVSSRTLTRWAETNKVRHVRSPGGKRLYHMDDIHKLFGTEREKAKVCYARVSSSKQRGDRERQVADLRAAYPTHEIISEIGSGLNYNRPKFKTLLDRVHCGDISEVCIAHKDRLCRYGIELVEFIFHKSATKLVVHFKDDQDAEHELAEDLLAVVNYFVAKNNGMRSAKRRKLREAPSGEVPQDQVTSDNGTEEHPAPVVRHGEVDVQQSGTSHPRRLPAQ